MIRRLALLAMLSLPAACDREPFRFDHPTPLPEDTVVPTPTPLAEGEFSLVAAFATGDTSDGCQLGALPETVIIAGPGPIKQIAGQRVADAEGAFDGTTLFLVGERVRSFRPLADCVLHERERWTALRADETTPYLEGELSVSRELAEGTACGDALPDITLPCVSRRAIQLTWISARPVIAGAEPAPQEIGIESATPEPTATPKAKPAPKKKKPPKKGKKAPAAPADPVPDEPAEEGAPP